MKLSSCFEREREHALNLCDDLNERSLTINAVDPMFTRCQCWRREDGGDGNNLSSGYSQKAVPSSSRQVLVLVSPAQFMHEKPQLTFFNML